MMAESSQTLAFLGATGGCTLRTLVSALESSNSYECIALARNPEKLKDLVRAKGISQEIIDSRLVIVQGDAREEKDVEKFLTSGKAFPDTVLFGIGRAFS